MKFRAKLMHIALFGFLSATSQAEWIEGGLVTKVHVGGPNGPMYFSAVTVKNSGCPGSHQYAFVHNASNSQAMYSLLLAAYISQKPISVSVTGECLSGFPKVDSVQLKNTNIPH